MLRRRTVVVAFAISLVLHFFILSSREVMGLILGANSAPRPKPEKPLVFDLVKPKTEKPKPPPEPEKQKWFTDAEGNKEKPSAPTNLHGVEDSVAKDHAPKDKKPDGIPNLDGKSEMPAVRDQAPVLGEGKPKPSGAVTPPQVVAPPQPARPQSPPAAEPPRETPPVKEARPKMEPGKAKEAELAKLEKRPLPVKATPEPKPNVGAPSPRKEEGPAKESQRKEPEPVARPVEVAALPTPSIAPERAEAPPVPPTPAAPGPSLPPREMEKLRSMFPQSSAGKEGEPSFNIHLDTYAPYYKHLAERLELTWHLLRRYEAGLPVPGAPQEIKLIFTFTVLRDGTIKDVNMLSDGGDPMIGNEIRRVIERTTLNPFPDVIQEEKLLVQPVIHFHYY